MVKSYKIAIYDFNHCGINDSFNSIIYNAQFNAVKYTHETVSNSYN